MQNKKVVVISVIFLIAFFVIGSNVYKGYESENKSNISNEQREVLVRSDSIVVGPKDAKVELVEFFDPACGACAYFHPHIKKIMSDYEGMVKVVYRYAPFHQNSPYAVKMLEGALQQGKFEEVLDLVFKTQDKWVINHVVNPRELWIILEKSNLVDMKALSAVMEDSKIDDKIKQEIADTKTLKVTKTPTYFVNEELLVDFSLENLIELVESKL